MHDFLLAKEIIEEILKIVEEKKLSGVKSASIEIGSVALAHDGLPHHAEDVSLENLEFGLKNIAQKTILKDARFKIKKTEGRNWKIVNLEV